MSIFLRKPRSHLITMLAVIVCIAVSSGLIINLLYVVKTLADTASTTSGVTEDSVMWARLGAGLSEDPFSASKQSAHIHALRAIPGVEAAATTSSLPFTERGKYTFQLSRDTLNGDPPRTPATAYLWGQDAASALGVSFLAGRDFLPDEYVPYAMFSPDPVPSSALITRSLATRLWPDDRAIGQQIRVNWISTSTTTVVGVIDDLRSPAPDGTASDSQAIVFPAGHIPNPIFTIRFNGEPSIIRSRIEGELYSNDPGIIVNSVETLDQTRSLYYRGDTVMLWTLVVLASVMSAMTATGLVAVLNHWVASRRREIGIRRALGARRIDILGQFLKESAGLATIGGLLGMLICLLVNLEFMRHYETDRIPLTWLPVAVLTAIAIGLLSSIPSAITASHQDPAIASKI